MFHTGEKPNQCSHCEKAFISKGVLHQHMITHTEEKSYHCSHFEKTLDKSKLDRHMRTHTGEKHKCTQCEKAFCTEESSLPAYKDSYRGEHISVYTQAKKHIYVTYVIKVFHEKKT